MTNLMIFLIHKQAGGAAIATIPVRRESRSKRLNQTHCTKIIGSVFALNTVVGLHCCTVLLKRGTVCHAI